jgi:predicted nucleic acid-binding protein
MNGSSLFVDTNIIIYFLSGDPTLTSLLDNKRLFVSIITKLELLSYHELNDREEKAIEMFLHDCTIIEVTPAVQQEAVKIRRKHRLKLPDAIVAASATVFDLPFLTSDKSLQRVQDLELLYYQKS